MPDAAAECQEPQPDGGPVKALYGEDDRYTAEANALDIQVHDALKPVFDRWAALGYSIRQISHVVQGAAYELELMAMLDVAVEPPKGN